MVANGSEQETWYETDEHGLGGAALGVLADLSEAAPVSPSNPRRWYHSDHIALFSNMYLERWVRGDVTLHTAPHRVRAAAQQHVDRWRGALPFSETERHIVAVAYDPLESVTSSEVPAAIRREEFEVVEGGLRRVVSGRDLMRRWFSWRRGLDEFAGAGGVDLAEKALADLAEMLIRPSKMPDRFYQLRGGERLVPFQGD